MYCLIPYLNILANIIINKYFTSCIFLISNENIYLGMPLVKITPDNNFEINVNRSLHFGCENIVVQVNKAETVVNNFEKLIKLSIQRFNDRKYLILLSNQQKLELYSSLHFVPNVLFLVPKNYTISDSLVNDCEVVFSLMSHKFVGAYGNDEIIELDTWFSKNMSFLENNNLYPDKISNAQGRVMKMATFSYKPYAIVGETLEESDGTEMRVALEYARKHNLTAELVVDQVHEWGEIYSNWTGNGILGNVAMDNADIGFGALYTWYHEFFYLDLSSPIVRTGITCLAPAPRLLSGWLSPFFPFNMLLWTAVITSFVMCLLSYLLVSYVNSRLDHSPDYDRILKTLLIIRIFLLQSFPNEKATNLKKPPIRYLVAAILILSLLIATCYNSGLVSSMTIPRYEKPISTVQDLSESNMAWGATHEAWIFSIESATQPTIVNILHNFKILTEEQLRSKTSTRDYAFSIERLPAGHFAIGSYITENIVSNLLLMTEDIYWEQCVIMTRKNSPYIPTLNMLILRIHEAGLHSVWETQVALKHLDYQVQLEVKLLSQRKHPDQEPIKLRLAHVEGVFVILIIGLGVAINSFILELAIYKCKKRFYRRKVRYSKSHLSADLLWLRGKTLGYGTQVHGFSHR